MANAGQRRPARDRRHHRSGHGARRPLGRRRPAWWVALLGGTGLILALAAAPHGSVARAATARVAQTRHAARLTAAGGKADGSAAAATCDGQPAPWMDPRLSPDQRAALLVSNMTLDQEAQETAAVSTATESREVPAIPSLCIPALLLTNGSAGISTGGPVQYPATALPAPISLAATWDPAAAARYGEVEGSEALDQGRNDVEGPDINIARVPTSGRTFEAYGEDPYLVGQIAAGDIGGIQSRGVIATAKHFAANNQETDRTTINELISQRTLEEIYFPAFQAAVRAGTGSVMCAKNLVNGVHACDSAALLGVLDNDWHFPGFVVSDFSSIHSTVDAANAGADLELPSADYFGPALETAVENGQVSRATLDGMVQRILRSMFALGLFDRPAPSQQPIPAAADGTVSRNLAEAGTVLLKNDENVLPLGSAGGNSAGGNSADGSPPGANTGTGSIAVIGPEAGTTSAGGDGSSKVAPLYTVSPLQAITAEAAKRHIRVSYAGALPITFPASGSAVPADTPQQYPGVNGTAVYSEGLEVGYRYDDAQGITPLFPFGFGLSYTTFAFSHLTVSGPTGGNHPAVRITAEVTNTGGRAGTEVAQLYVGDPAAIQEPPRQLRAFQRVYVRPGQHEVLHFTLPVSSVAYWDTAAQNWAVAPGTYQVYVGDSSAPPNLPLQGSFVLANPASGR